MIHMKRIIIIGSLDEAHNNPGLHAAAGPGLAEECATLLFRYVPPEQWSTPNFVFKHDLEVNGGPPGTSMKKRLQYPSFQQM
ncbi:hypothetical protein J5N97_022783 [Dioscorea zingiberensis]|uniref:Uncharacterized protein n=1 Tax=Dioscorea zingiberensis TaxID=325984 RepID=A0A9D5CAS5_9LILI|nr:hypothetical protein J5N97_022783 [Dioscorea zingiberensis]